MTLDEVIEKLEDSGIHEIVLSTPNQLLNWLKELRELKAAKTKVTCRMVPLEPDCRGYTDVFICTHCHQHIHLGFIRKEYSGNFCIECGAEVKEVE